MVRRSLKTAKPSNNDSRNRPKPMAPPGGLGKRRRYSCGGKVKK